MKHDIGKNILAVALVLLSISIAYFTYGIIQVGNNIIRSVDKIDNQLPKVLEELEAYRKIVPEILAESQAYRVQIPQVFQRVDKMQEQLDSVSVQFDSALNNNLPSLITRTDKMQSQIDQFYTELPKILTRVDNTSKVLANTNKNIAEISNQIPFVMAEVSAVREVIPGYLSRIEGIVAESKDITEEAGKGVFTGLIKGIVSAPFELLKTPKKMFGDDFQLKRFFTEEDLKMSLDTTIAVLSKDELSSQNWRNPETKNEGKVSAVEEYQFKARRCRKLQFRMLAANGQKEELSRDACLNEDGQWERME